MPKYETITKGVRSHETSKGTSYLVGVELPPRPDTVEHSYSFHLGTFTDLNETIAVRQKAEELMLSFEGQALIEALTQLKNAHKIKAKICCGKKFPKTYKYCPFCGKNLI